MSSGITIKFELSLRLPRVAEIANIPPSSYWGITMATRKASDVKFAGRSQEEILALIMDSAVAATKEAVAENDRLGLDSPGSRNGQLVVRKPGGELITLKS
jgi:hypothetical protein